MADTNETICDIIAEKRRLAKEIRDNANGTFWNKEESKAEDLEYDADRLDRARMKMEIEIANLRKDNAKLREALVYLIQNESTLFEANLTGGELELLHLITNKARAALATTSNQNIQEAN